MRTVSLLSLQTCPNRAQPIFVGFFFVRYQLNSCCAMEVDHRAHYRVDIAEHMDEQSLRKKLSQAADVKRIFRCSIHPPCLGASSRAGSFEPPLSNFHFDGAPFAFYFEVPPVAQDQVIN